MMMMTNFQEIIITVDADGFEEDVIATAPYAVWCCDFWEQLGCNVAWVETVEVGAKICPVGFDGVRLEGFAATKEAAEAVAEAIKGEVTP